MHRTKFSPLDMPPTPEKRRHHTQLRTLREMADEFGVHVNALANAMRHHPVGAPKPKVRAGFTSHTKQYYEPRQVRIWWALVGLPDHADATAA